MGIRSFLSKPLASLVAGQTSKWSLNPGIYQEKIRRNIVSKARGTVFGKDHGFEDIKNHDDFKKQVPIRDYEALSSYIKKILDGNSSVLWPGKPEYFAKTSGTTSGTKYIPITKDSIPG